MNTLKYECINDGSEFFLTGDVEFTQFNVLYSRFLILFRKSVLGVEEAINGRTSSFLFNRHWIRTHIATRRKFSLLHLLAFTVLCPIREAARILISQRSSIIQNI